MYEGHVYDVPAEKTLAHTKALLQGRAINDDISESNIPTEHQVSIQLQDNIDELKVERCLLHVPSSAPGADEISVVILRAC